MTVDPTRMWKRACVIVPAWAGTSVFFTAVLMLSDLGGHKSLGFVLYGNAVHFAIWTCLLPVLWCASSALPITAGKRAWNGLLLLASVVVLAALVATCYWAVIYSSYFPYRATYPSLRAVLESELIRFV